ncbi:hypothetical protein [Nocardioides sp. GY 10113]|uniref:hypothetical protein n=1 Tax=Nocardioides sp. GY 10113 TaxID=2569761 RepID=UPI00197D1ED7|nr:hypothetical protein [Nocardioides sp. GY 10113]
MDAYSDTPDDPLPRAGRLAWWGTAWLRGDIGPDDLLDAVTGSDVAHLVVGAPAGAAGLVPLLADARDRGATAVGAAFPAAGDPIGVRGPAPFTAAAVEAGEAALLLGAEEALVPTVVGRAVEWVRHPAARRPPPDLGEADRALRSAVLDAANGLADLDVAAWSPEIADELHDLRHGTGLVAPPGVPDACRALAGRAIHLQDVIALALESEGGALSLGEIERRRALLAPLERAVRAALTAACSPDGWPPAIASPR